MTPLSKTVMSEWTLKHPGGPMTLCHRLGVARSRTKRKSIKDLTRTESHDHFQRTLAATKWSVIKGWHCFRHSFISNLASSGVDQRFIDEWVGHLSEEMRRRYRHLLPSKLKAVLASVFGGG